MTNVYKSIVMAVVFGNAIAFPVVWYTFPWGTYLVDPTTYYIVQAESLGLLIAACIFVYEWVRYSKKPNITLFKGLKLRSKVKK
jgi:hypothetical protein